MEEDPELSVDISNDLSLDPVTLITNLNKKFKKDNIEWRCDDIIGYQYQQEKVLMYFEFQYH